MLCAWLMIIVLCFPVQSMAEALKISSGEEQQETIISDEEQENLSDEDIIAGNDESFSEDISIENSELFSVNEIKNESENFLESVSEKQNNTSVMENTQSDLSITENEDDTNIAKEEATEESTKEEATEESTKEETTEEATKEETTEEATGETTTEEENGTNEEELTPPNPMTVAFLEKAMGLEPDGTYNMRSGEPPETISVQVWDQENKVLEEEKTIPMGWIKNAGIEEDIEKDGKTYHFCGALVKNTRCVFIGKYEDTIYYSTDGYSASDMGIASGVELGNRIVKLKYWQYHTVTLKNISTDLSYGTLSATDISVDENGEFVYTEQKTDKTNDEIAVRVYAGEKFSWSATPETSKTTGAKRIIESITINPERTFYPSDFTGDAKYGASYTWEQIENDIEIRAAFVENKKLHVIFDSTFIFPEYGLPSDITFDAGVTSVEVKGNGDRHIIEKDYFFTMDDEKITALSLDGQQLNMPTFPTHLISHEAVTKNGDYTITVEIYKHTMADVEYGYKIKVENPKGIYNDLNFTPTYEQTKKSRLGLFLAVDTGEKDDSGNEIIEQRIDGVDLYNWTGSKFEWQDGTKIFHMRAGATRKARLFFFNIKKGYTIRQDNQIWVTNLDGDDDYYWEKTNDISTIPDVWDKDNGGPNLIGHNWTDLNPGEARVQANKAGYKWAVYLAGDNLTNKHNVYQLGIQVMRVNAYIVYDNPTDQGEVTGMPENPVSGP